MENDPKNRFPCEACGHLLPQPAEVEKDPDGLFQRNVRFFHRIDRGAIDANFAGRVDATERSPSRRECFR